MDILGCTGTVSQRATVLHKFILLAQALKEHAHNLFSFSAVMKGLEMPQVSRSRRATPLLGGQVRRASLSPCRSCGWR